MKPLAEMSDEEVHELIIAAHEGMIQYADKIGVGGLSVAGHYNLYRATEEAIWREHRRAILKEFGCLICYDTGDVVSVDSPTGWARCPECQEPNEVQQYP